MDGDNMLVATVYVIGKEGQSPLENEGVGDKFVPDPQRMESVATWFLNNGFEIGGAQATLSIIGKEELYTKVLGLGEEEIESGRIYEIPDDSFLKPLVAGIEFQGQGELF